MKKYYLAGFINLHAVFPAFVYPVFVDQSNPKCYYLEDGFSKTIKSFREIELDSLLPMYKNKSLLQESELQYSVGSQTVYAFMKDPTDVVYGNIDFLVQFLWNYQRTISDNLLIDEINTFLKECFIQKYKDGFEQRVLLEYSQPTPPVHPSDYMLKERKNIFCHLHEQLCSFSYNNIGLPHLNALNLQLINKLAYDWCSFVGIRTPYTDLYGSVSYQMLLEENRMLVDDFLRLSDTYASLILCDGCNNEDSTERFIERMLVKKTWLLSDEELRHFHARYLNNFRDLMPMKDFGYLSYSEIENLLCQLQAENRTLRKLTSFLIDVLEDRGICSSETIPFDTRR